LWISCDRFAALYADGLKKQKTYHVYNIQAASYLDNGR